MWQPEVLQFSRLVQNIITLSDINADAFTDEFMYVCFDFDKYRVC